MTDDALDDLAAYLRREMNWAKQGGAEVTAGRLQDQLAALERARALLAAQEQITSPIWPFKESPGEIAEKLEDAFRHFGSWLGAVRNVFIEQRAGNAGPPPAQEPRPEPAPTVEIDERRLSDQDVAVLAAMPYDITRRAADEITALRKQLEDADQHMADVNEAALEQIAAAERERDEAYEAYRYLQQRLESIGYHGWAHDKDDAIRALAKGSTT